MVSKKDANTKKNKINVNRAKVDLNKAQAKLLVRTSQNIIEVIDICEIVEQAEVEFIEKDTFTKLKEAQLKTLNEVKTAAAASLIIVPYKTYHYNDSISIDSSFIKAKINQISARIKKQKELLSALKNNTFNGTIVKLAEKIMPVLDKNLLAINNLQANMNLIKSKP